MNTVTDGYVDFERRRELAIKIVSFEGDQLEKAINIIRWGQPHLFGHKGAPEIDIDTFDQRTLVALYRNVCPGQPLATPPPSGRDSRSGRAGAGEPAAPHAWGRDVDDDAAQVGARLDGVALGVAADEEDQSRPADDNDPAIFEMKREIAVKIISFEGDELEEAIDIIRRGQPGEEKELDLDRLNQRTLFALYRFVCPSK
ncbi:transcription initiation at TATA-containing promoter protein [Rhodotorula kratochvilovae]